MLAPAIRVSFNALNSASGSAPDSTMAAPAFTAILSVAKTASIVILSVSASKLTESAAVTSVARMPPVVVISETLSPTSPPACTSVAVIESAARMSMAPSTVSTSFRMRVPRPPSTISPLPMDEASTALPSASSSLLAGSKSAPSTAVPPISSCAVSMMVVAA